MSNLTIRPAHASEPEVRAIFDLLLRMFGESPMHSLNAKKALASIYQVCTHEAAFVVLDADDMLVASVGLAEERFWYSDEPVLATRWLYALPAHRGDQGAWGMMRDEVRGLSETTGMAAYLDVFDPEKSAKPRKAGRLESGFARFAFEPRGRRMRLTPAEGVA